MKSTRSLHLLFLSAAVAGLAACGGGGGGDATANSPAPSPAPAPSPSPSPSPSPAPAPAPAPTSSGLPAATATISQSAGTAVELAKKVYNVQLKGAGGAAAVKVGGAAPVVGSASVNCPGGGTVTFSGPATGMAATYNACVVGGYTYGGTATVSYVASGSTISSYVVTYGGSVSDPTVAPTLTVAGPNGYSATLGGRTTCDASSGAMLCTAEYSSIRWGADFTYDYAGNVADGSTGCECGATSIVNVIAHGVTPTAGTADVVGASGSAAVTRTGATTFSVVLTSSGATVTYPVTVTP